MKRISRFILLFLATISTGLGIVCFCALFWIKSSQGLQWIQTRINAEIPGRFSIKKHQLSILQPSLDLYGVVLQDSGGLDLASFSLLKVRLDWPSLWRREIRLKQILLETPWLDLTMDSAGNLKLMNGLISPDNEKQSETPETNSANLPFNIVFESIQLIDGKISYAQPENAMRLDTAGLTITAWGDLKMQSGNLELDFDIAHFSGGDIKMEPAHVALKASLEGEKLTVPTLSLGSDQFNLNLSGSVDNLFGTPVVDGTLSLDSQFSELKSIFSLAGEYSGPLKADLTFKGPISNPDGRLVLSIDNSQLGGQPLDHADLAIELKDRMVTIEKAGLYLAEGSVLLRGQVGLRDVFPTGFLFAPQENHSIEYDLTLEHDIPDIQQWLKRYINIQGVTNGQATLTGKGIHVSDISAQLTFEAAAQKLLGPGMDRPVNGEVQLMATVDQGTIALSRLSASADGAEFSGDGRYQIANGDLEAKLSLIADDLSRIFAVVGIPSVGGACNATVTALGSLRQPQFSLDLATKNLKVASYSPGDLVVQASMDQDGVVDLSKIDLQNKGSRLQGGGLLKWLPDENGLDPDFVNNITFNISNLSAADFMDSPPVSGVFDGELQLGGPLGALTGELSLKGTALRTEGAEIGDLKALLHLDKGTVFIDQLGLQNNNSAFGTTGSVHLLTPGTPGLVKDPALNLTLFSKHFDPADFVEMARGDFSFDGVLTGSVRKPSGQGSLRGNSIRVADQPIDSLSVDLRLKDNRLWLDKFLVALVPGEQLEGGGSLGMDKTIDLSVKSDPISTSSIQQLEEIFPGHGILRLDGTCKGDLENPDIDGKIIISDLTVNDEAMEDVSLSFGIHDMLATVKGNLNFGMDAAYNLKKGDFTARLLFDRTETAGYFRALGKPDFRGTLNGQVKADGNINDGANISAQLDLNDVHLLYKDISLIKSDRIRATMADRELKIPETELTLLSSGRLQLKGTAQIDGPLAMEMDGRIPLAVAEVFSEELVDTTGVLTLAGELKGDTADPQVDVRMELEDVGLTLPGLVQRLHDLEGSIHLTSESITVDSFKGFLDSGTFSMKGTIDHNKFTPTKVDLGLKAQALPLEIVDTMSLLLNGDIQITGQDRNAAATGEIVLLDGLYYKDVKISLLDMATRRSRKVAPESDPLTLPFFDTVNLNIKVKSRQPLMVENNLAQLEINPDLRIAGTLERPVVGGRAQVKSGTVSFQKHTFDVTKGVIDFTNPYKTEAEIDIKGETTIRTWTIALTIKGSPDNLELKLSSEPMESDSDILSLILFGQTAKEIAGGKGDKKRSTSQIMAEMLADSFGEDIKKTAGVDILELEDSEGGDNQESEGVRVTVGKHLSDRMTLKYAVESKDGAVVQKAITEYKLMEHILVSGFQDNQGIFGAELVFRIEFR